MSIQWDWLGWFRKSTVLSQCRNRTERKKIDRMHFATSAYNDDDAVPLPLGLDFQDFVQIFIDENSPNKYDKASKVIEQLQ